MNLNINASKSMRITGFMITVTDKNHKKTHGFVNAF